MKNLGLSKYCADIRKFDANLLTDTFDSLVRDKDEIKNRMAEKLSRYKVELAIQFDDLFPREVG